MGQVLIRGSHKNKGSINPDDPVPFFTLIFMHILVTGANLAMKCP